MGNIILDYSFASAEPERHPMALYGRVCKTGRAMAGGLLSCGQSNKEWRYFEYHRAEDSVRVNVIGCELALKDVYAKVE